MKALPLLPITSKVSVRRADLRQTGQRCGTDGVGAGDGPHPMSHAVEPSLDSFRLWSFCRRLAHARVVRYPHLGVPQRTSGIRGLNDREIGTIAPGQTLWIASEGAHPPMPTESDYAERWRTLAIEAVAVAQEMSDPESKRVLLFIADTYKRLAERAQASKDQRR